MNPFTLISSVIMTTAFLMLPCHAFSKKNSSVVFEPGPWKPLKSTSSPFSASMPLAPAAAAILNRRGFLNPSATEISSQSYQYSRPGTLLKNREGSSSTFGLDIPDSNLRLLLDIDELSAKTTHDNFKLKVIERDESGMVNLPKRNGNGNKYSVPLRPPVPLSQPPIASLSSSSFAPNSNQKYQIGYIRTTDLHTALNSGALPPGSKAFPVPQSVKFSQPLVHANHMVDKMKSEKNLLLNPSNSLDAQPFIPMSHNKPSLSSSPGQALPLTSSPVLASELEPSAQTFSKTNSRPNNKPAQGPATVSSPVKSLRKSRKLKNKNSSSEKRSQRLADTTTSSTTTSTTTTTTTTEASPTTTAEVPSSSRASSEKPSFRVSEELRFEEQQKQTEVPDEQIEDVQIQSNNAQIKEVGNQQQQDQEREDVPTSSYARQNQQQQQQEEGQNQQVRTTKSPEMAAVKTPPGNQSIGRLRNANTIESEDSDDGNSSSGSRSNTSENDDSDNSDDFDDGFDLLRSQPLSATYSSTCSPKAGTGAKISSGDLESMSLKDYAKNLNADSMFTKLPGSEEMLQSMLDFANSGYTLFLPSNDAIARLPKQLISRLNQDKEELRKMIENHVSEDKRQMSTSMTAMTMSSRVTSGRLRINRAPSDTILVNGNRIVSMNNRGPAGGSVHVIDGLMYPVADKNLMETMKSCNRFDGFVTLAEGTGLGDSLSTGGPYTVFVPSNEALQKIPDVDLERIRNNMTALKEFLMFHVAQGSFYSHDLRDGQFIPSLIPDQDIQVGVRVDGCNRRLVEANVSPLYRADIPASNGVIHVIDWILKPNDRDWCEGTVLPRRR